MTLEDEESIVCVSFEHVTCLYFYMHGILNFISLTNQNRTVLFMPIILSSEPSLGYEKIWKSRPVESLAESYVFLFREDQIKMKIIL